MAGSVAPSWTPNICNLRASAFAVSGSGSGSCVCSGSSSGHSLQSLAGLRRSGAVDALSLRCGRDLQGFVSGAAGAVRATTGVSAVAESWEKATELTIASPAAEEEEAGSASGRGIATSADVEFVKSVPGAGSRNASAEDRVWSRSFNSATDSYRPGARRSSEIAGTSSSFRPGPIPSSIASKQKGRNGFVDRWMAPGSKVHDVKQILKRLENAEPTDEGVKAAMQGWDMAVNPRDMTTVIANLKWNKAQAFFNWLQSEGYEVNVIVYNVLLGRFRAGRVWSNAENFAYQMIKDGIKLDNYSYSTLISCALQCSFPTEALKWFDKMHEDGCVPDEVTYGNMALVYSRLGRYGDAEELYECLRQTGWKPDKVTFGTMVNVYSRGGNYFKAAAVIREMQEKGLQPEAVVYNTLIKYLAREGRIGQAKRVFQDMNKAGVKPTEYTLSLMVDVHGRAGETKEAFQLFTQMKEEKLPLDVVVYNSLLKMCAEVGLVGEAENLIAGMVGRGLKPDIVTYKSMINVYAKEGRIKDAEKFVNRMVEVGFKRDVIVYSCLIKACGIRKDFKTAATFLDEMVADGCEVDDKCCGVLLSLMNSCETTEDRTVVVNCLRKSKPVLSGIVDVLLAEFLDLDALEELVRTLLIESEEGSHRPFCNAFVDLCWSLDKKYTAQKLLSLADSLGVYNGGLMTQTAKLWMLHLRSLSFNAAECGLFAWMQHLREKVELGEEFPEALVIETGVGGRSRGDAIRLFDVVLSKLKDIGAPFEPSSERTDWIISDGSATKKWLTASRSDEGLE